MSRPGSLLLSVRLVSLSAVLLLGCSGTESEPEATSESETQIGDGDGDGDEGGDGDMPAPGGATGNGDDSCDGEEGCACYGNGTCNDGLSCFSDLCVDVGSGGSGSGGEDSAGSNSGGTGSGGENTGGMMMGSGGMMMGSGGMMMGSGGMMMGSGGMMMGSGGAGSGGGPSGGPCVGTGTASCESVIPSLRFGTATCVDSMWDISDCSACFLGNEVACNENINGTPNKLGTAECDGAGLYDWSTCTLCAPGEMLSCEAAPSGGLDWGTATCAVDELGWNTAACLLCEPTDGVIDCDEIVGGAETYTSGTASCNASGDGYDESTCGYCGDDVRNGPEACDNADGPASTCFDMGLPEGDSGGADLPCAVTCEIDTRSCYSCTMGVSDDDCILSDCSGGSGCRDKQCADDGDCTFACGSGDSCTGMSCNDASCLYDCDSNALCEYECFDGAECSNNAAYHAIIDATCRSGADCDISCGGEANCTVTCDTGSNCSVAATAFNGSVTGQARCTSGTCTYDFSNQQDNAMGVHCATGATCNITVSGWQTTLDTIVCDAGATCNITCGDQANSCSCTGAGCP